MTEHSQQDSLASALRSERKRRRLSLRDLSHEIGVSFNTLSRVERGHVPDLKNYDLIVSWLGGPGQTLFDQSTREESTPEQIARHLYSDSRLKPEHADRIITLIQDMYEKLAAPTPTIAVHLRSSQTFLPEVGRQLSAVLQDMYTALAVEETT